MPRWNGGVIGAANNPTSSSAKGIWSLSEATKAIRAGLWPPSNAGADPYFENVTLLLPGDGTNGAQNNTFLDSSTNNFTITRNGNTTQGTFSPFSKVDGRWGAYFDGTGDYLSVSNNALIATGDFTMEAWCYTGRSNAYQGIISSGDSSNTAGARIVQGNTGNVEFWVNGQSYTSTALPLNQWNHVAIVRSGSGSSNISCYLNGTRLAQLTQTSTTSNNTVVVGRYYNNGTDQYHWLGYISNARFVVGSAVYSGATYTVPTAPLTAITNTQLLTCQSNRFIDNSTNAFAITRNGDVAVTTFSPFPTLTAYAAGTNGGSGYFDGTGDYLTVADSATLEPGSSDFTIECWIYPTATGSYLGVFSKRTNNATDYSPIQILINSGTMILLASTTGSSWAVNANASTSPPLNAWSHIAVVRNGTASNNLVLYLNGVSVATGSVSNTALVNNAGAWAIAADSDDGGGNFVGYISGFRYVLGSAVYTSGFTPPTAPPTAITNTSMLLSYTNGGIIDTSMSNDLETVGNAQISTTQSKFGGASMYFDGTGDYLDARLGPVQVLGGDFTVEMWVYPTTITGSNRTFLFLENGSNSAAFFMYGATGYVGLDISNVATYNLGSTAITTNSWQHLAFVRSGSTLTAYINGTSVGTATVTASLGGSGVMRIGAGASAGSPYFGYIDEMRVTKGYARYTANFTAPVGPFNGFGD